MTHSIHANNQEETSLAISDLMRNKLIITDDNWYFHPSCVAMEYLVKTDKTWVCPDRGTGYWYNLEAPNLSINNVAWSYPEAGGRYTNIKGWIGFWGRDTPASVAKINNEPASMET